MPRIKAGKIVAISFMKRSSQKMPAPVRSYIIWTSLIYLWLEFFKSKNYVWLPFNSSGDLVWRRRATNIIINCLPFILAVRQNLQWTHCLVKTADKYIFSLTTLKRRHTNVPINPTPLSLSAMNFYGCLQSQSFNKGITFWIRIHTAAQHLSGDTSPSPGCNTATSFLPVAAACG